ncbi:FAD-binding oxidoreductase [Armatimonas sp.]|uniref:FAD-binding oxidoreductase n=1 Tax=Armatimonas sp. TaxID=1872638 RepID=UPI00286A6AF0|nr:FAD-binding oxidoreductase [Armatimonas sp.]
MIPELLTDLDSRQQASRSWFPPHLKTRPVLCESVAQPESAEEVAALVAWAAANGKSLRAVGGGSGTSELAFVDIAIDTSRLTKLSWSEEDMTVTVGAGVTISAIEEQLTGHAYTLGQSLGSATLATVGGCIATDAHGLFTGRYGSFRESVLSQSTLGGIIVEATLKMHPQPEARAWTVFDFGDFDDACDALRLIHRSDARPSLARITSPQRMMLAFEGDEIVQTGHFQLAYAVCQQLGGTPGDPDDGERWLESRQRSDRWSANAQSETFADFMRLRAPWSSLAETCQRLRSVLEGRVTSLDIEIAHPTPHGATVELAFTLHGDEPRYRELRELIFPSRKV